MITFKDYLVEADASNEVKEGDIFVAAIVAGGSQYINMYQVLEVKSGMATIKQINYKVTNHNKYGGEASPLKDDFKKKAHEETYKIKKTSNGPVLSVKDGMGQRYTAQKHKPGETYEIEHYD